MHCKVCVIHLLQPYYLNQGIRGIKLLYLPPYSPDYNPIEEFFSAYKAFIRQHATEFQLAVEGGECEGDTETRPLVYKDTPRQR